MSIAFYFILDCLVSENSLCICILCSASYCKQNFFNHFNIKVECNHLRTYSFTQNTNLLSPTCILGLTDEHDGRKLMWLPTELPPYVHIIISTISDEKMDCLPCAQKLLAGHDRSFLEVPKLQEDCAWRMMARWLRQAHRTLTDSQTDLVVKAFSKCPSPLFLQVG